MFSLHCDLNGFTKVVPRFAAQTNRAVRFRVVFAGFWRRTAFRIAGGGGGGGVPENVATTRIVWPWTVTLHAPVVQEWP